MGANGGMAQNAAERRQVKLFANTGPPKLGHPAVKSPGFPRVWPSLAFTACLKHLNLQAFTTLADDRISVLPVDSC